MLLGTSNNVVLPGDCTYREGEVFFWHFLNAESSEKCSSSARREGNWVEFTDRMMVLCCGTTLLEFKKCLILFKCSLKDDVPASWPKKNKLQEWKWENKGILIAAFGLTATVRNKFSCCCYIIVILLLIEQLLRGCLVQQHSPHIESCLFYEHKWIPYLCFTVVCI